MVNQLVNEFYTQFLFKIDALPQNVIFLLDIPVNVFNNLSPDLIYILIPEGFHFPPRPTTETKHKGNQRLILLRNVAVEADNQRKK